ncbi:unnamed protein product [Trichobilharzia szidati]|nr:unnamed protein product [Trichobilharzia szidati]
MVNQSKKQRTQSPVKLMTNFKSLIATSSNILPTNGYSEPQYSLVCRKRRAETEDKTILTASISTTPKNSVPSAHTETLPTPYVLIEKLQPSSSVSVLSSEIELLKLSIGELKAELRDLKNNKSVDPGISDTNTKISNLSGQISDIRLQVCELTPLTILMKTVDLNKLDNESISKVDNLINFVTTEVTKRLDAKLNAIVYNVPDNEALKKVQRILLSEAKMPNSKTKCYRLKKSQHDKCCPIRFQFETPAEARKFTHSQHTLSQLRNYKLIKVAVDKTVIERRVYNYHTESNCGINYRTLQAAIIPNPLGDTVESTAPPLSNHTELSSQRATPTERPLNCNQIANKTIPPTTVDLDMSLNNPRKNVKIPQKLTLSSPSHKSIGKKEKNMTPNHANSNNGSISKPTFPTVNSIGTHNVRNSTMAHTDNQRQNNTTLKSTSQNSTTNNSGHSQYGTLINFDRIYGTSLLGTNPQSSTFETLTRTPLVLNNRWNNRPWSSQGPNHFLSPASLSALKKQLVGMLTLLNR